MIDAWARPRAAYSLISLGPQQRGDKVEFVLRYAGPVAGKKSNALPNKHAVRAAISPQLATLCERDPFFGDARIPDLLTGRLGKDGLAFNHDPGHINNNKLFCRVPIEGYEFVPLVHQQNYTACELDVIWLRGERAGDRPKGGDLDNRLKTLFDGLRMPHNASELHDKGDKKKPERIYSLMDDDSRITRINVSTFQLLDPGALGAKGTHVELLIRVNVFVTKHTWGNISVL
jgi:hypothetical protein